MQLSPIIQKKKGFSGIRCFTISFSFFFFLFRFFAAIQDNLVQVQILFEQLVERPLGRRIGDFQFQL